MYSLFAPAPFTSYPFFALNSFALAIISSFINSSLDIAIYVSMSGEDNDFKTAEFFILGTVLARGIPCDHKSP